MIWIVLKNDKDFLKDNRFILKSQQRRRIEKHKIFTEEVNEAALSGNNNKRIQSISFIKTSAKETHKYKICKKEESKYNNMKNNTRMINFLEVTE